MTTEQQETTDPLRPNVKAFKATSFQLSQFEVVVPGTTEGFFAASEWVCIEKAQREDDPMFEVFDGSVSARENPKSDGAEFEEEREAHMSQDGAAETQETGLSDEESGEVASVSSQEVADIKQALATAHLERTELEEEHARQLEELRVQVAEEARLENERQSEERLKAIEERYATLIEDMNTQIQEGIEGVERRAVEFAVQIAKKLVGAIVEVNPEYILGIIKEATKLTGGATIKTIRVSPQDLEFVKMLSPEKQFKEFDGSWSFQADETIHAGCVLETSSGEVELDLDKAWERIKDSVVKVR